MTGFIRGLFKRNSDRPEQTYYLDEDNAKTLGDVDYMRRSSTIRRTFPKNVAESSAVISSMEKKKDFKSPLTRSALNEVVEDRNDQAVSFSSFQPQMPNRSFGAQRSSYSTSPYSLEPDRRRPDSKMDEFRKMAREMKKK
ncbi:MAG: hypothetical protein HC825_09550 [Oscillatoriales cyanobacterium RM1_1_9]|nr:hypothetical protein [Oscillatoriales cyanobacterium SM2_3_0]NJO45851.1 hypothetical protein [Oscillatoriales cyanobacterium RM2_1_1]NJO71840.1 hypothetical protein [Oscillatoriales cyanobacterium RM1_1_9]